MSNHEPLWSSRLLDGSHQQGGDPAQLRRLSNRQASRSLILFVILAIGATGLLILQALNK